MVGLSFTKIKITFLKNKITVGKFISLPKLSLSFIGERIVFYLTGINKLLFTLIKLLFTINRNVPLKSVWVLLLTNAPHPTKILFINGVWYVNGF